MVRKLALSDLRGDQLGLDSEILDGVDEGEGSELVKTQRGLNAAAAEQEVGGGEQTLPDGGLERFLETQNAIAEFLPRHSIDQIFELDQVEADRDGETVGAGDGALDVGNLPVCPGHFVHWSPRNQFV